MGHVVSQDELKPDPSKTQGVQEIPTPSNKQELKRLMDGQLSSEVCSLCGTSKFQVVTDVVIPHV